MGPCMKAPSKSARLNSARLKHFGHVWIFFIIVASAHGTEGVTTDYNVGETCDLGVWDPGSLLQIDSRSAVQSETQDAPNADKSKSMKQIAARAKPKLKTHAMPKKIEQLSKYLVALTYTIFSVVCAGLCLIGLPSKQPQDPRVKEGCSNSWWIFMGLIYALVYFSTDQYVPSLPQMEKDLGGSQSLMSGTVQINLVVKAVFGLLAAGLSDRIGRRPVVLFCIFLLSMASFCCACANQIEWFLLARVLQGMGESIEPVVFAMARDHFQDPEERVRIIAALQMIAFVGIAVAPLFGGVCAHFLDWRSTFFSLALIWLLMGFYAAANMMECCPDGPHESYLKNVQRILDPHLICLLLSESFIMGAYFIFNANSSYLAEVSFGQSELPSSMIMFSFAVCCCLGALCLDQIQTTVLSRGQWAASLLATSGIVSLFLTAFFPHDLWAYLVGSFVQASMMIASLVAANVLFFEPLEDCAGMAASFEILAQSVPPSSFSAFATQSMISFREPVLGLTLPQSSCCIAAAALFWLACRFRPKADAKQSTEDPDEKKLAKEDSWGSVSTATSRTEVQDCE